MYDKQLATSAYAYVEQHELNSVFEINVTLKTGSDPEQVAKEIDNILSDFLADGPTQSELSRVVTSTNAAAIRGYEKIGGFGGKATALAQGELYAGDPGFYKTRLQWLNNANAVSLLYSGTPAMKTDFTATGKRTFKGSVNDAYFGVKRYFLGNFYDSREQDYIDFHLGKIKPKRNQA